MASTPTVRLVTPRDLDLFAALDRGPLTVAQVLKVSQTFTYPFTTARRVQERLHELTAAGRVRQWPYSTATRGILTYYTLSPLGYRLLYGGDVPLPHWRHFNAVALARQPHTRALSDFVVHTLVAAHRAQLPLTDFHRENTLCLTVGEDYLYPDSAFALGTPEGRTFTFFVELDNATERVRSPKDLDSWERKIRLYDQLQDSRAERFRVLVVATGHPTRLQHILALAAERVRNSQRSLLYGITLTAYLATENALTERCFRSHRDQRVALVLPSDSADKASSTAPTAELATHTDLVYSPSLAVTTATVS